MTYLLIAGLVLSVALNIYLGRRLWQAMKYNEGLFTTALDAMVERDNLKANG